MIGLKTQKMFFLAVLGIVLLGIVPGIAAQSTPDLTAANIAVIYVNEACSHCRMYLSNLKMFLEKEGFSVTEKNMVNDLGARKEWALFHEKNGIPIEFQGHLTVVLNGSFAIEGHVPIKLVKQVFEKYPDKVFPLIALLQDEMVNEDQVESYSVWTPEQAVKCAPNQLPGECSVLPSSSGKENPLFLTGLVGLSGLAAGLHPCTIGVLLFFLAFLFSIQLLRKNAFKIGAAYIAGVFIAYFLIGFGLMQAMVFTEPHFAAKASAVLVFVIGVLNILRFFVPSINGFSLPSFSKEFVAQNVEKASIPAAFIVGIVVGVCSFGCTAGIYFSVLGFVVTEPSLGLVLLALYNFLFVLPLIVILFLASNEKTVERIELLQARHNKKLFLAAGILMVLMAIFLWIYVGGF